MRTAITHFLDTEGKGILTAAEARREGWSEDVIRTLRRQGVIVRVARGTYVSTALLHPEAAEVRRLGKEAVAERTHLLLLDALLRSHGTKVAASHQSASLAWGLPVSASALGRVHLAHTAPGRTARRHELYSLHTHHLTDVIVRHEGRLVVAPALAVIGTALTSGLRAGVVAIDAALQRGLTTREEVAELLARMRFTPHLTVARESLARADGLAESPKETELRLLLVRLGLTVVAQFWIRTSNGRYYRVDFYLPQLGVVLEYDGRLKYVGDSGARALTAEKAREDDLRLDGFGVGRVGAEQLNLGDLTRIVHAAARQSQPQALRRSPEPPAWAA